MKHIATTEIKDRLEYLRKCIEAESISYGEIFELQDLAEYIEEGDVQLLQWAGVPESLELAENTPSPWAAGGEGPGEEDGPWAEDWEERSNPPGAVTMGNIPLTKLEKTEK